MSHRANSFSNDQVMFDLLTIQIWAVYVFPFLRKVMKFQTVKFESVN